MILKLNRMAYRGEFIFLGGRYRNVEATNQRLHMVADPLYTETTFQRRSLGS